jgi:flagellar motor switch protein FliG
MNGLPSLPPAKTLFTSIEKVAVLFLTLDRPLAASLLRRLQASDRTAIEQAALALGNLELAHVTSIVEEFESAVAQRPDLVTSPQDINALFNESLVPLAASPPSAEAEPSIWDELSQLADKKLLNLLLREHPQVSAFILANLSATRAAELIAQFAPNVRDTLLARMLAMAPVAPEVEAAIIVGLRSAFHNEPDASTDAKATHSVANILNRLDKSEVDTTLAVLEEVYPQHVDELRKRLFAFEDLLRLEPKAVALIFDPVSTERIIVALKGAGSELQALVLASLTARARRMAEAELANPEMPQADQIASARRAIVDRVLEMANRGEIELMTAAKSAASN